VGKVDQGQTASEDQAVPPADADKVNDEWVKFDKPWLFFAAGKLPYVARNLNQFPLASPVDGLIDVAVQERTSRMKLLKSIDTGPTGQHFFIPEVHYMKCTGYRVTPLAKQGFVSIDGERFPYEPFEVRVQKGMASFLSPTGKFVNDFAGEQLTK